MNDFSIVKSVDDFFVVLVVSFVVWFLYTATDWGIIPGNREPQFASITKLKWFLHQAFPKCSSAHDRCPVPILQSASQYFARGSGSLIHQQNQFARFKYSGFLSPVIFSWAAC